MERLDRLKIKGEKNVSLKEVSQDGLAPENYFLTNFMPTYYRYKSKWILPKTSSINCVATIKNDSIEIKEIRNLKKGDMVVVGRSTDGSEGIYVDRGAFKNCKGLSENRSVESDFSESYDYLFNLMREEKKNKGYIVWVLGPSVVFDYDTRKALTRLVENGYVDCVLAGNAMATHDLEGGYLGTALGQDIYTQENMPMGHYNHLDLLNEVRRLSSIEKFVQEGKVRDGFMKSLVEREIPYVLAGSIRDDGPLPEVYSNVGEALDKMKFHLEKASLVIGLATMLHNLSAANLAPSYRIGKNKKILPVHMCMVDVSENVINKLGAARENQAYIPIITNVQDFLVNCERNLLVDKEER